VLAPMVNLSVCATVIPDSVETTSSLSLSVYLLTAITSNYLAPLLHGGSLTCFTEDGHSSLVGSIENLVYQHMSYSCLPVLHDVSSGSHLLVFSLRLHLLPTCPLWIYPIHLPEILTSFILYASLYIRGAKLVCKASRYV